VDGDTWEKVQKELTNMGKSPIEVMNWVTVRQHTLTEVVDRLRNSWIEEDATYYAVKACDSVGPWLYCPADGLQPIDYAELRSALNDPSDRDKVYRAVLERRLVYEGHSRFDAHWALNQLPWCHESRGQSFATEIEEYGQANAVRDLAQLILEEQERCRAEEQAERERREAEAKTPHAIIGKILADPPQFPINGKPRQLLVALGASPDGRLPLHEIIPKLLGVRQAAIKPKHLNYLRVIASRASGRILNTGYGVRVQRDNFDGKYWVTFCDD
jgi:hypothetical protein